MIIFVSTIMLCSLIFVVSIPVIAALQNIGKQLKGIRAALERPSEPSVPRKEPDPGGGYA